MPLRLRHGYAADLHRCLPTSDIDRPRSFLLMQVRTATQHRSVRFKLVVSS